MVAPPRTGAFLFRKAPNAPPPMARILPRSITMVPFVMVPLVTVVALSYAGLLEGSVLTETVFSWPGLGLYITNSLQNADMNAVLGGTIVVGTIFIGLNLLSDGLYRLLDPRTRARS